MIVAVERLSRAPQTLGFADITSKQVLGHGYVQHVDGSESYEVQFAVNLTAAEADAVRLRLTTANANEEATRARAWAAADGLRAIRDSSGALTATQLSNAVRLLARVALYLLRLQLGRTESVEAEPAATTTSTVGAIGPSAAAKKA